MGRTPLHRTIIFSLLIVLFSYLLCFERASTEVDSAFISLRYVANIINGNGAVFNKGERIEAISNSTWVFLISGVSYLSNVNEPQKIILLPKIIGVVLFSISGIVLFLLLKLITNNDVQAFFFSLIFCLNPFIAYFSASGLENPLVYLLLILSLYFFLKYLQKKNTYYIILSDIFIGLLSISRPEGIIYLLVYLYILIIIFLKDGLIDTKVFAISIFISLTVYILFSIWRFFYYGDIIPNTAYFSFDFSFNKLISGIKYFFSFVLFFAIFIPLLTKTEYFRYTQLKTYHKIIFKMVIIFFVLHSIICIYVCGESIPCYRTLLFDIPLFVIFLSILTFETIKRQSNNKFLYIILIFCFIANIFIGKDIQRPSGSGFNLKNNHLFSKGNLNDVEHKLKEISLPGDKILSNNIGKIGLFNLDLYFTDIYGSNDKYISKEIKGQYFYRSAPDYFLNLSFKYLMLNYDTIIQSYNFNNNDFSKLFKYSPVKDLLLHKDFPSIYKPIYISHNGVIFQNIRNNN